MRVGPRIRLLDQVRHRTGGSIAEMSLAEIRQARRWWSTSTVAAALVQTAEQDPLRDEGTAHAERLAEAGVPTRHTRYVGGPLGFVSLPGACSPAHQGVAELVDFVRASLTVGLAGPGRCPLWPGRPARSPVTPEPVRGRTSATGGGAIRRVGGVRRGSGRPGGRT